MQWITFLGPTLAVTVTFLLNRYAIRTAVVKIDEVHKIVNGQHSALEQLVTDREATIERRDATIETLKAES